MDNKYLPVYTEKWLPSGNLSYPKGIQVTYNPFSFGDLLKINQSNLDRIQLYNFILEGVDVVGMDKYDLTYYDVVYLGWRRKTASLGTTLVDVKSYCPNCDFCNLDNIDLSNLDFVDVGIKKLPLKLKLSSCELTFRFMTIREYIKLVTEEKHEDIINIYASCVDNINFEEAYSIIYNATGDDLERIGILDSLLYHGLKELDVECKNEECGYKYTVKLTDSQEAEILKPFRGKETIIRDEISFG